jgi:hypothetical protein
MESHNGHLAVLCNNRNNVFQVIKRFLKILGVLKPVERVPLFSFRNLDTYEIMPMQEVCSPNTVTRYQGGSACISPCTYVPHVDPSVLICAIKDNVDLEYVIPGLASATNPGDFMELYTWSSTYFCAVL